MEKKWLFVIGILVVIAVTAMAMFGITSVTGSAIYGKCWQTTQPLSANSEIVLETQGCIVDNGNSKVCCPLNDCPDLEEVKCGP